MLKKLNDNSNVIVAAFKVIYFVMTFAVFNIYFAYTSVLTVFSYVLAVFGALILLNRLIRFKDYSQLNYLKISVLFLISAAVSIIVNVKYGLLENVQGLVWTTFELLILLLVSPKATRDNVKNETRILFIAVILLTFVAAVDSILMVFQQYGGFKNVNGNLVVFGFVWNRLWGSYTDPNHGAVLAVVSVLISVYGLTDLKSKVLKALLCINILIEIIYIAFSDSRTGMLCFVVSIFVLVFFLLLNKRNVFISLVLAIVIACCGFGLDKLTMFAYNDLYLKYCVNDEVEKKASHHMDFEEDDEGNVSATVKKDKHSTMGRTDEKTEDVSNNRFSIWKSGIEIFKTTPIVGTSYRNIIPYAKENLPNTFIVREKFYCMHNLIFDVLVSQGLIGFVLLLGYAYLILKNIVDLIKYRNQLVNKREANLLVLLLSIVLALGLAGMLVSAIVYVNCAIGVLFWISLGYINKLIYQEELNGKV